MGKAALFGRGGLVEKRGDGVDLRPSTLHAVCPEARGASRAELPAATFGQSGTQENAIAIRQPEPFPMKILRDRARRHFSHVRPYIVGNAVLDIGAAEGWTGDLVQSEAPRRSVRLLDVNDFNQTDLPLTVYDGQTMPFDDNSFDTSLLLLVLHHCADPDRVLSEALRVTRERLIITESVYHYKIGRAMLFMADSLVNSLRSSSRMAMALNFRTTSEWRAGFARLELAEYHREWISRGFHKQVLFVLDVDQDKGGRSSTLEEGTSSSS